jgi:hypothetical protein
MFNTAQNKLLALIGVSFTIALAGDIMVTPVIPAPWLRLAYACIAAVALTFLFTRAAEAQ